MSVRERLDAVLPPVLYGIRAAAAVCIALGLAFALELDQAYWAGTTAALVCQPVLGSALRKAAFRTFGTLVGAGAAVLLFACFPQDRVGFMLGLAGWCAMCGFVGSRLTLFAAYGAMLAGYTAAIIAGDVVSSPDQAFDVALARVTEIELGIAVATVVLATTQFGDSRKRLAAALQALAADAVACLPAALEPDAGRPPKPVDSCALLGRLAALDPLIDQAVGEAAHWRIRLGPVRAAQNGLFACIAEVARLRLGGDAWLEQGSERNRLWPVLPLGLRGHALSTSPPSLASDCRAAAQAVLAQPEPGLRAVAVRVADALSGAATAAEVAAWLVDPNRPEPASNPACAAPVDPVPALLNAARAYLVVLAAAAVWMATRWPNGPTAITWAAIPILLMSPRQETAFQAALQFSVGTVLAAGLAAVIKFAVLPQVQTFWALSAALAAVLAPLAALSTIPRLTLLVGPATMNLVPLVAPANQISYDPGVFYNSAFGIVAGCAIAGVALRVLPPVSVSVRASRIVAVAEADCAAVRTGAWRPTAVQWRDRMRTRTGTLPSGASPAAFQLLLALFSSGADVIRARAASLPAGAAWEAR